MNYARRSILPDENPVQIVLQPEIRKDAIKVFGKSLFKIVSLPHISILTDREMILIQEGIRKRSADDNSYGGIYHYIPLGKITSIEINDFKGDLFTLSIHKTDSIILDSRFTPSKREEVKVLINQVEMITNKL